MAVNFGKYILLDKIATGGMAEIWLAKQTGVEGFEKLVVIKKILPHFTDSKEFVSMFLDEARVAAKLNHPNVVQIYDLGKEQNGYYIAMEFISGADIKEILTTSIKQGHFLPFPFAVNIISQAAEGLHYAHTLADMYGSPMNIVHRDVSPQNILVTHTGTVKIVDFGIAKASTTTQETRAGTLKGKFAYMSPEQALGKELDGRSDVFALGIILYEITVGKRLFKSDSELKTLRMITEEAIAPPVAVNPKYPKVLSDIVMKALAKDVNDRYANAREMRVALDDFLKTYPKPSSNLELSAWMRKTFAKTIADTKIRHEKLLREEPDEFLLANILDQQEKKQDPGSEVSQLSSLFANSNQPLGESGSGKYSNNSAIMTNIYQQPMTASSSIQIDNSKSKVLLIGISFIFLAIIALFTLYLLNQKKDKGCKIGYTGDNCSVCAKGYQDINGVCKLLKCPEGHTGKNCTECAIGFQDKDVDGFCKPNCARAKLNCKNGCSDATGIAKCVDKKDKKDKKAVVEIPITSNPSFAKIVINDKAFPKMTDTLLSFEVGKKYVIAVEKNGFKRVIKTITFTKDITNLNFKLEATNHLRGKSKLFIFKEPKEAIVYIDGVKFDSQEKELIFNSLVEGEHSIQIKLDGYKQYSANISVSEIKDSRVSVKLKKAAIKYVDVSISSIPTKANVYYKNKKIGTTPLNNFSIKSSRKYKFKITKKGYRSKTFTNTSLDKEIIVTLSRIKSTNKTVKVNKTDKTDKTDKVEKNTKVNTKYGKINMNTTPFTNVYFKGKKIGVTPLFGYKLPVGRHKINLRNDGAFINTTIPIIIRENETLPQVINFRKGYLQIKATGTPIVTLNGKKIGTGSLKKTLYEGSYRVVLTGMNGVKKYKIKIKPNRTELIEYK